LSTELPKALRPSIVRGLVVESAWRAIKKSPALREFHERVMCGQKGRKKIATVAVARKLLSIMRAMQMTEGKRQKTEGGRRMVSSE